MHWVIAYDIHSTRRRNRVARQLERAGLRVQKSVFVADMSKRALRKLMRQLAALIDPDTDQVAAWPLRQASDAPRPQAGFPPGPEFQQSIVW